MKHERGFSLLELMIALGLSAILFVTMDSIYASLWLTRATLEKQHDIQRGRQLPQSVFADQIFHAGYLGCRSVSDGIKIITPEKIPESFFIQNGQALHSEGGKLVVHDTRNHGVLLTSPIEENTRLAPVELKNKSDWLLISDCASAELLPYGGQTRLSYQPPVHLFPVIIQGWSIKNKTLYAEQIYPPMQAQPMLSSVGDWQWERFGSLLRLAWQGDIWVFELGNS
jgi:prepilin-type N-terminal cleavage/methylation domain-containing protein